MALDAGGLGRSPRPLRTGLTDNHGLIWTAGILLRIRCSPKHASCPSCARSAGEYRTGQNRQILGPGGRNPNGGLVE
jgi:hypothetical protein